MGHIFCCCKKKKKATKHDASLQSEINDILTNKKDLIKLDTTQKQCITGNFLNVDYKPKDEGNSKENDSGNIRMAQSLVSPRKRMKLEIKNKQTPKKNIIPKEDDKRFLHEFKDKLRCFFCGGESCKHEDFNNNLDNNNAIKGLNSNFITSSVIASQRPCEVLIKEYELIAVFKELDIGLIVNLQREGEHPYCGPNAYKLTSSGYSYNPSMFTSDNIKCKLSGWKDMSVPSSMNFMLDIVKEMTHIVNDDNKKVLVHCHAGYGRTGVVIACYLLFNSDKSVETVITEIRSIRNRCIESSDQKSFCQKFHAFLHQTRLLFDEKETIDVYLKRQEDLLYGNEVMKYGYIPKIITKTFEKIISIKNKYSLENIQIYILLKGVNMNWNEEFEDILDLLKLLLNKNNWALFDEIENLSLIVEVLYEWFEMYVCYIISPERTELVVYSDLFLSYKNQSRVIGNKSDQQIIEELFTLIRKIYHCFEYEILYQFASFCALIKPVNDSDKAEFDKMIERMAYGMLGFTAAQVFNQEGESESIEALINGLIEIIKLIYNSLIDENSLIDAEIISPLRKNSQMLSLVKKTTHFSRHKQSEDNIAFSSYSIPNSPFITKLKQCKELDPKDQQMLSAYEYLTNHFYSKFSGISGENSPNKFAMSSPNEIPSEGKFEGSVSDYIKNNLDKVIEEAINQKSYSSSCSSSGSPPVIELTHMKIGTTPKIASRPPEPCSVNHNDNKDYHFSGKSNNEYHVNNHTKSAEASKQLSPRSHLTATKKNKSSILTYETFYKRMMTNTQDNNIKQSSHNAKVSGGTQKDNSIVTQKKSSNHLPTLEVLTQDKNLIQELIEFKQRKERRQSTMKTKIQFEMNNAKLKEIALKIKLNAENPDTIIDVPKE